MLSVFCVGSVFSCEVEREAFVFERTSDDILQNMQQTDLISRIKVLEYEYGKLAFERDEFEKVAEELGVALEERTAQLEDVTAQLEERTADLRETVEMIGQN